MKKILFLMLVVVTVLSTSCNKNQKVVKKLDGRWELVIQDGEAVSAEEKLVYNFSNCKLKKYEYCDIEITDSEGEVSRSDYKTTDDGETLLIRESLGEDVNIELTFRIDELTSKDLKMTLSFLGLTSKLEFKKV